MENPESTLPKEDSIERKNSTSSLSPENPERDFLDAEIKAEIDLIAERIENMRKILKRKK